MCMVTTRATTSRETNQLERNMQNRSGRKNRADKGEVQVEVRVPKHMVGTIVGKNGSTIKRLQMETATRIKVDSEGADKGDECLVQISGKDSVSVQHARQKISILVSSKSDVFTVTIPLPQHMVGRVIGKGGLRIRDLQRASGARIIIEKSTTGKSGDSAQPEGKETSQTTTTIIKGTVHQIDLAKSLIQEILDEAADFEARLQKAIGGRQRRGHGDTTGTCSNAEGKGISKGDEEEGANIVENREEAHYTIPIDTLEAHHSDGFIEVMVSQVISPHHFYVQKTNDRLDNLNDKMESVYSGTQGYALPAKDVRPGTLVAARFSDGTWYRGRIHTTDSSTDADISMVSVFFFDFGDYLQLSVSDCRELLCQFHYLPQQAVECYLHGVEDCTESDPAYEQAMDKFDDLSQGEQRWKRLMLKVAHLRDGKPCVQLVDTRGERDIHIAKELINAKLLVRKPNCH